MRWRSAFGTHLSTLLHITPFIFVYYLKSFEVPNTLYYLVHIYIHILMLEHIVYLRLYNHSIRLAKDVSIDIILKCIKKLLWIPENQNLPMYCNM